MELPHSGHGAGRGHVLADEVERGGARLVQRDVVDASMAGSRPLRVCMSRTTSSMAASASAGWWTTRSGPSATISSWSSVTSVAISTITSRAGSRPVISRSIHTSTPARLRGRCALRVRRPPSGRRRGGDNGRRAAHPGRPPRPRPAPAGLRPPRRRRAPTWWRGEDAVLPPPRRPGAGGARAWRWRCPRATPGSSSPAAGWPCATG